MKPTIEAVQSGQRWWWWRLDPEGEMYALHVSVVTRDSGGGYGLVYTSHAYQVLLVDGRNIERMGGEWLGPVSTPDDVAALRAEREHYAALARQTHPLRASRPEPPPQPGRENVAKALLKWIGDAWMDVVLRGSADTAPAPALDDATDLIAARDAFGRAKHGGPLMTHNGRDSIEDALQETGDKLQYTEQAFMEGRDLSPLLRLAVVEMAHLIDRARKSGCDVSGLMAALRALCEEG